MGRTRVNLRVVTDRLVLDEQIALTGNQRRLTQVHHNLAVPQHNALARKRLGRPVRNIEHPLHRRARRDLHSRRMVQFRVILVPLRRIGYINVRSNRLLGSAIVRLPLPRHIARRVRDRRRDPHEHPSYHHHAVHHHHARHPPVV